MTKTDIFLTNTQEKILQQIELNNPSIKTSLKPIEAKQIAGANYELLTIAFEKAGKFGTFFRLFMDEDLKLLFDEDLQNASAKNRKLARIYFTLAENMLEFKSFCHTIVEIATFMNGIILKHKTENPFVKIVEENRQLESILSALEIDQNEIIGEIKPYKNPVELLANFIIEYFNAHRILELQEEEELFSTRIHIATKKYLEVYSKKETAKNTDFYIKISKLLKILS